MPLAALALLVFRSESSRTALVAQESRTQSALPETAFGSTVTEHNAQNGNGYVGREVCRECHVENYELHGMHGHAHTFAMASEEKIASKFAGREYEYGEPYGRYEYFRDEDGLAVRIPGEVEEAFPLQYALGSGHNAITLLSLAKDSEKGTVAYEHRGTWFRDRDRLGPTPGQPLVVPETELERFGMKHVDNVMQKCIYCHTTTGTVSIRKLWV